MMTKNLFRDAMSRLGAAVNVVTTEGSNGSVGFTASAVCSVTDEPPTLLVCINRSSKSYLAFATSEHLCVNTLSAAQESIADAFASLPTMQQRFAQGGWERLLTGAPVLKQAVQSFDCRIASIQDVGTHAVFFCEVLAVQHSDDRKGLVYFDRAYHSIERQVEVESY